MDKIYEKAVAIWLGRRLNLDPEKITDVDFYVDEGYHSSYSEDYGSMDESASHGIEFKNGKYYEQYSLNGLVTPGQFVQECCEIVKELVEQTEGSRLKCVKILRVPSA